MEEIEKNSKGLNSSVLKRTGRKKSESRSKFNLWRRAKRAVGKEEG